MDSLSSVDAEKMVLADGVASVVRTAAGVENWKQNELLEEERLDSIQQGLARCFHYLDCCRKNL